MPAGGERSAASLSGYFFLLFTCLRAEQYEPSLASPTTIAPSCQFTPVLYPALLRISNLTPPPQYDSLDPYIVLFSSSPCPSFPVLQFPLPCSSFPYLVPDSPTVFQFPLPIAAMFQLSAHRPMWGHTPSYIPHASSQWRQNHNPSTQRRIDTTVTSCFLFQFVDRYP